MIVRYNLIFIIFFLLLFTTMTYAQDFDLVEFNTRRLEINRQGMTILGGWAVGNMILGGVQMGRTEGHVKSFHQMNLAWNSVNLVIAGFGYYNAMRSGTDYTLIETFAEQKGIENILLLNAGLDVGYMLGGLYLIERSKNSLKRQDMLKGFGQSILLQGGFLFAFDIIMVMVHQKHWKNFSPSIETMMFENGQMGLQMGIHWNF